jgi:hypothetical protein
MTGIAWTDERVEQLKKLWGAGLSASQVAAELRCGATRNSVIGKVHRLGLSKRSTLVSSPQKIRARSPRPIRSINASARQFYQPSVESVAEGFQPPQYRAPTSGRSYYADNPHKSKQRATVLMAGEPAPLMIQYIEREEIQCSFICTADGEPKAVCGHPTMTIRGQRGIARSSYCPFHHGKFHQGYAA